jgi:uncharacterized protein (TIGR02145 family)
VPDKDEWKTLVNYLTANGYGYEGSGDDIAKSLATTSYWQDFSTPGVTGNDQTSNNSSGFSAAPAGGRDGLNGSYTGKGGSTVFWTSSLSGFNGAVSNVLSYILSTVLESNSDKRAGSSVRCLNDKN